MVAITPGPGLFIVADTAIDTGHMVLMGVRLDIGVAVNAV
jgi:hypothetical protein